MYIKISQTTTISSPLKESIVIIYILGIPGQETEYENKSKDNLAPDENIFFRNNNKKTSRKCIMYLMK